ncbi:MAG: energy transducer TonB [Polaribacter sp.]
MKNSKKPIRKLEKFSNIFTQLGLVLVLFVVYVTLEHQTEQKQLKDIAFYEPTTTQIEPSTEIFFTKEVKVIQKVEIPKTDVFIADAPIEKAKNEDIETVIDLPKDDPTPINPEDIIEIAIPVKEGPETVPFLLIENAPVFKGCEGLSKKENKLCFDKKMKQFVQRNFDTDLANDLGLDTGTHRIYTEFVIDKTGNIIDLRVRAPHKKLENEAGRLIKKLPQFTPGKQREKPVKVKYTLPILFSVQ